MRVRLYGRHGHGTGLQRNPLYVAPGSTPTCPRGVLPLASRTILGFSVARLDCFRLTLKGHDIGRTDTIITWTIREVIDPALGVPANAPLGDAGARGSVGTNGCAISPSPHKPLPCSRTVRSHARDRSM